MNRNRLSTNLAKPSEIDLEETVSNLLASASNYDIHPDGKFELNHQVFILKVEGM
jgi:hypothetical protein